MSDNQKRCAACTHFDKQARPNNPRYGRCVVPLPILPAWLAAPDLYPRNIEGANFVTTASGHDCAMWRGLSKADDPTATAQTIEISEDETTTDEEAAPARRQRYRRQPGSAP